MTTFFVPGLPVAQPRIRATRQGRIYTPKTASDWKACVVIAARRAISAPFSGPIALTLSFKLPRPRSHYGTGKNAETVKDSAPDWVASRPDIDNMAKAAMDALSNAGAWTDDALVVQLQTQKRYCDSDEAGAWIEIVDAP